MGERRGTKGLELWCRRMTEGYPGVKVVNMTTSWRDGLAFCAIIHHFRPDLIEFSKLNKDDIYHNNELAFRVAERHLGIPALLEPEDMVEFAVPDRLSILTYLSQFYQAFVVGQGKTSARIASKRPATTSPEHTLVSAASTSPPTKASLPGAGKVRREPCAKCGLPVFIAERLNVGKLLYHRTCFRCARCNSQLTLANYYETENGEFCCETCPDEEQSASVLTRSLSDEEKSASLKQNEQKDSYSAAFETALEFPKDDTLKRSSTLNSSQYSKARSFFISSQVGDDANSDSGNDDEPPDLPKTAPPTRSDDSFSDSGFPTNKQETHVHIVSASLGKLEESHDIVTKDAISAEGNTSSLVKARMRLFETKSDATNETHSVNCNVPLKNSTSANLEIANECTESDRLNDKIQEQQSTIEVKPELPEEVEDLNNDFDSSMAEVGEEISESVAVEDPKSVLTEDPIIVISDTETESPIIVISDTETESPINETPHTEASDTKQEVETTPPALDMSYDVSSVKSEEVLEISDEPMICSPEKDQNSEEVVSVETLKENKEEGTAVCEMTKPVPEKEYPDDLNPFGDDSEVVTKSDPLNPFEEEEEDTEPSQQPSPVPAARKKIKPTAEDKEMSRIYIERISVNPFEEEDVVEPTKRRVIAAPKISLNPFWSDDEDNEEKPTPKPRVSKSSMGTPEPRPRKSVSSSETSITHSALATRRKKLAPRPPGGESGPSSLTSSPSHSVTHSPRVTPKFRKAKKAPAPPPPTSTPIEKTTVPFSVALEDDFEQDKIAKDEQNRNRQSQHVTLDESAESFAPNKSTYGIWKRRKGQAPSRPIPQRRTIKSMPLTEVRRELDVIEIQQQGLEKQGVRLEQMIREKCEAPDVNPDDLLAPEIEDMVLQLFELVNEKNELFRKQAELMYLRRQHKLEEEHAEVEYQIRCLMLQPEANKTDSDKAKEEELINRLVDIVERRNEIIECLEMDRVREAEEDYSINNQLNLYTLKKEDKSSEKTKKEKSKHKKEKKLKLKGHKVDADKDIDESEGSTSSIKDKKKKKFAIF